MDIDKQKPTYCGWANCKVILSIVGISACLFLVGAMYFLVKFYNQNQVIYRQLADYNNKLISTPNQSLILDENFDRRMRKLFDEVSLVPRSSFFTHFDPDFFSYRFGISDLLNNNNYKINNSTIEVLDKEYLITIAIPGFTKEQIKIELKGNTLIISADASENLKENDEGKSINKKFKQVISLNSDIERDSIKTTLKDGILTINIARNKQLSEPKIINIE